MSRVTLADRAAAATERVKEVLDEHNAFSKARSIISGDAQFFAAIPKPEQIRLQLVDDNISEKKEGMKRVIAGMCKGIDMSCLFPDVVKNIHVNSIELRKLVYYYIVHYAEDRPNESLLSISAFQHDLLDSSMHVRSLALRMLSSIRISAIHPLVMIAIRKCSTDIAPVVRKTAAISLSQVHVVSGGDESQEIILQLIHQFLGDRSIEVVGAAALSFLEICPNQFELIHKHYRKICHSLIDCDEWGQVMLLHILLRYARTQFVDPQAKHIKNKPSNVPVEENGDITTPETSDTESEDSHKGIEELKLHSDHRLLIQCAKPLLMSMNRAVVISVVSLLYHIAPHKELDHCVRPLLRLLNGPSEGHMIVLSCIHTISLQQPELFVPHVREFFLNPDDADNVRQLKLRIIASLTRPKNFTIVSHEFRSCLRSFNVKKVVATVHGLGLINITSKDMSSCILQLITPLLSHKSPEVVTECVIVLRQLVVQGSDQAHIVKIVHRLLVQLMKGEIKAVAARASIIWLVGENIGMHVAIAKSAPDCFRVLAKNFSNEDLQVRKQALTLGSKLWFHLEGEGEVADRFKQIFFYVLELVKYDSDYELRDRGRIIECAIDRQSAEFATIKEAMLAQKPLPCQCDPFVESAKYQMGSLSHLCGTALLGYQDLPVWPLKAPVCEAREPPTTAKKSDESSSSADNMSNEASESDSDDVSNSSSGSSSFSSSLTSTPSSRSSSVHSQANSEANTSETKPPSSVPIARKIISKVIIQGGGRNTTTTTATTVEKPTAQENTDTELAHISAMSSNNNAVLNDSRDEGAMEEKEETPRSNNESTPQSVEDEERDAEKEENKEEIMEH